MIWFEQTQLYLKDVLCIHDISFTVMYRFVSEFWSKTWTELFSRLTIRTLFVICRKGVAWGACEQKLTDFRYASFGVAKQHFCKKSHQATVLSILFSSWQHLRGEFYRKKSLLGKKYTAANVAALHWRVKYCCV